LDMNGKDYGSNVLINYNDRVLDYGNYITQGAKTYIGYLSLNATYKLFHNMAIDLTLLHRTERSAVSSYNALDNCLSLTFRWNIGKRLNEF